MRIQLELSQDKVQRLKTLMVTLEIDSYKDLFNNALSMLDWVIEETQSGREIAAVNEAEKCYRVLVHPVLAPVIRSANGHLNGHQRAEIQTTKNGSDDVGAP